MQRLPLLLALLVAAGGAAAAAVPPVPRAPAPAAQRLTIVPAPSGAANSSSSSSQGSGSSSSGSSPTGGTRAAAAIGFSGGGFLAPFHTGAGAVLKELGVVGRDTKLAGSSAGAIHAASSCSLSPGEELAANLRFSDRCRGSGACRGFLDSALRQALAEALPADVAERCRGRLWTTVTEARPGSERDRGLLLGPNWGARQQVINAVAASSYLPAQSGGLVTNALMPEGVPAGYDGGFGNLLPTPPGASNAITVSANPPTPGVDIRDAVAALLTMLVDSASNQSLTAAASYLPLDPQPPPEPKLDIYPGLSGWLPVPAPIWSSWGLDVQNRSVLLDIYNQGRRDAAAFAGQRGLARADIQRALDATAPEALLKQAALKAQQRGSSKP